MLQPLLDGLRLKRERRTRLRELRAIAQPLIREDEILGQLKDHHGGLLFLNTLTRDSAVDLLRRCGIIALCEKAGYEKPQIELDTTDAFKHVLRITTGVSDEPPLVEVVVRAASYYWEELPTHPSEINLLVAEWALLQNPRASFDDSRPALPGQVYPGLGVGERVIEFLVEMAHHLSVDGIVENPQYYHAGVMYSKGFHFLHPETEGTLKALMRDLSHLSFVEAAWAVHEGRVREGRRRFRWVPEEQVLPLAPFIGEYFGSTEYRQAVDAAAERHSFEVVPR